jgi:hypothetical protein
VGYTHTNLLFVDCLIISLLNFSGKYMETWIGTIIFISLSQLEFSYPFLKATYQVFNDQSLGASKPMGLNRIAKIGYGCLCLREIDFSCDKLYHLETAYFKYIFAHSRQIYGDLNRYNNIYLFVATRILLPFFESYIPSI